MLRSNRTGSLSILCAALVAALVLFSAPLAVAQHTIFAVDNANNLVRFNSATPGTIDSTVAITGLQAGEIIRGIDFRPATGQLYAVGVAGAAGNRLYLIDALTGVATQVGADGAFAFSGLHPGVDFNPVVDRVRIVSDIDDNLRVNPNDGTLAGTDTAVAYDATDVNNGADVIVVGAAYDNNFAGTTSTTLYVIDVGLDVLARQGDVGGAPLSPNTGQLFTIGALGVNFGNGGGFDIAADGTAYANNDADFYTIDLTTGAATLVGAVGGNPLRALAAVSPPVTCPPLQTLYGTAYVGNNGEALFYSINPASGLASLIGPVGFERVSGMAFRADGTLFATGERADGSNTSVLLTINPCTGIGTEVGATNLAAGNNDITDLSFRHSDGVLFGVAEFNDVVVTLDTATGNGTLIGNHNECGFGNSLAFDFDDTLFHADGDTCFLNTIDQTTGNATNVAALTFGAPLDTGDGRINAMDFNPMTGALFGSVPFIGFPATSTNLGTINKTTAAVTSVGATQSRLDAIAFVPQPADVAVTKVDDTGGTAILVGGTVTYTVTVTNNGPAIAGGIVLTDVLTFTGTVTQVGTSTPSQGTCDDSAFPTIICNLGALANAASASVTIQVTAGAGSEGTIVNDASITSFNDTNAANDTAQVVTGVGSADVSITKVDTVDPVAHPAVITYNVTVTNNALQTAGGVTVTDTFTGAAVTFNSAVPSQGTCNAALPIVCDLGDIPVTGVATITVMVNTAGAGTVTDTAVATTATTDPTPANNTAVETTLVNAIDLVVTKTDSPDPMAVGGGNITYVVTVSNTGNIAATTVGLTDTFSGAAVTHVSTTPSAGTCNTAGFPAITCDLGGTINAGANVTVTIVVTPTVGGTVTNTVSATAAEPEPTPANNTNIVQSTTVAATQDFSISVSPSSITILPGQSVTFTITITPLPFVASVSVDCTHSIPLASCSGPITINPGNVVTNGTITLTTTGFFVAQNRAPNTVAPVYALWLPVSGFGVLGLVLVNSRRRNLSEKRRALFVALLSLIILASLIAGCAFGRDRESEGTPGGSYTVTFTGTGGSTSHSTSATVNVQGSN